MSKPREIRTSAEALRATSPCRQSSAGARGAKAVRVGGRCKPACIGRRQPEQPRLDPARLARS